MDFNKLNSELYQQSAPYRFARKPTDFDKGYIKMSDWINDLCFYFEKKRKAQLVMDENEFLRVIQEHKEKVLELEDSLYKQGLLKSIDEVVHNTTTHSK